MENLRGRLPAQRAGLSRTQQHSSSYPQAPRCGSSRLLARSTATATRAPSPTAAAQEPGAVISQLVGKKVLQLAPDLSTVPLLDPITHRLPFAAALQIYSSAAGARSSSRSAACTPDSSSSSSGSLVELHYVISGKGHFSSVTSGEQQVALGPGDSIISLQGAAIFAAGPVLDQDSTPQQQQQQQGTSPAWSQLLGWLQQLHTAKPQQTSTAPASRAAAAVAGTAQQQHQTGSSSSSSNQLVMLQLLLPSELLTGEMLTHHAGHCHAVAQQLPWHSAALQQQPAAPPAAGSSIHLHGLASTDSIHEAHVCSLLGDGGLASPQQSASQEQQQSSHKEVSPLSHHHHQQEEQQHAATGTPSSTAGSPGSPGNSGSSSDSDSSGSAHAVLPRLDQQQILKRALSEVGAFRLPQQTNRLALLFGPHCSPAVCCSFGVEVFEPGHVTPLHIHNTAHELFFVLAGKGEAVFSNNSSQGSSQPTGPQQQQQQQRVQVSPGDVAVFPPGVVHGVDNPGASQLYCLQMMLPNEFFVEFVRSGEEAGRLDVLDVQALAAAASCG